MFNILRASLIVLLLMPFNVYSHGDDAYYHDESNLPNRSCWMSRIDNNIAIRTLSIPGAQHGASKNSNLNGDTNVEYQTDQTLSLQQLLNSGIRYIHLDNLTHKNYRKRYPKFEQIRELSSGTIGNITKTDLRAILITVKNFLMQNTSETILIRLKQKKGYALNQQYLSEGLDDISNSDDFKVQISQNDRRKTSLFWRGGDDPTMQEVRGKVIFITDATDSIGLNSNSFEIFEHSNISNNWGLYDRWLAVKNNLENARFVIRESSITYITGGGTGSTPYFTASGHSSSGTGAPRLLTGGTTAFPHYYPEFPRVSCLGSWCSVAFEGLNTLVKNLLKHFQEDANFLNNPFLRQLIQTLPSSTRFVGIIVASFPGIGLIDSVIELNDLTESNNATCDGG